MQLFQVKIVGNRRCKLLVRTVIVTNNKIFVVNMLEIVNCLFGGKRISNCGFMRLWKFLRFNERNNFFFYFFWQFQTFKCELRRGLWSPKTIYLRYQFEKTTNTLRAPPLYTKSKWAHIITFTPHEWIKYGMSANRQFKVEFAELFIANCENNQWRYASPKLDIDFAG